jgi:CheY-like chemotaxis protein
MISLKGLQILLVDDDIYDMRPTIDAMKAEGASVELATDGTGALRALERKRERPFDVLILDIMMDEGEAIEAHDEGRYTGVKVYERIRGALNLNVPIVVSTVVTDSRILNVFRKDPKVLILSKPYGFTELHQALSSLLRI